MPSRSIRPGTRAGSPPGCVTSSPALGSDGTSIYVGSFDHKLFALDPDTGQVRWSFATDAHIYASAGDSRQYLHRLGGRVRFRVRRRPGTCSGAMTRATRCAIPRAGKKAARAFLRGLLRRKALRTRCGEPWSYDTTQEESGAPRPQRPEWLAGAGPTRRLHRRRARPGLVRSLRLLPGKRDPRCSHKPSQDFGETLGVGGV